MKCADKFCQKSRKHEINSSNDLVGTSKNVQGGDDSSPPSAIRVKRNPVTVFVVILLEGLVSRGPSLYGVSQNLTGWQGNLTFTGIFPN